MSDIQQLLDDARERAGRYIAELDARGVAPTQAALDALAELREPTPETPTDAPTVLEQLDRIGSPATVATTGGRFFGYVVGGALPVTVAANWLATAWDQNAGTWNLAPSAAELEDVAAGWLLDILDLPRDAAVGFVTGSTMGAFASIAAARSALLKRTGYDVKRRGVTNAPRIRIVASEEMHPTNVASLRYAGIGSDEIERVPTDSQGRILPEQLPDLDGRTILMLQAGDINSGAFDRFEEICARAKAAGSWVHVDGAFGLWARASRTFKPLTAGLELADSWNVDGHKLLSLPQDSGIYVCRDAEAINDIFGVEATYIVADKQGRRRDPNTLTPELSRRARGVDFWAAIKHLGRSGIEDLVDRSCAHARRFAEGLSEAGYRIMNDVVLNQVVFGFDDEDRTRRALAAIQNSGVTWLGPTHWKGRYAMRISVSSWATTEDDVERSLEAMRAAASA